MKFRQLKVGDVLIRNGCPTGVVLECRPQDNVFRWMSLLNTKLGHVVNPDFERAHMWDEDVFDIYDVLLRGSEELTS